MLTFVSCTICAAKRDLKGTEYCAPRFMCSNYSARKLRESKFSVLDLQVNPIKPGLF